MKKIISFTMAIVMVLSMSIASMAATTIEDHYAQPGSYDVTITETVDMNGDAVDIYHPTNMTGNHALITWGNGTFANPYAYTEILSHIASYGYVIVCSVDSNQGTGELMKNAADWMIAENSNPDSMFYNQIDTDKVAAMGHSQGACGAVNVATSADYIDTVIPVSLVSATTLAGLGVSCDPNQITVPTLLMCGDWETWVMCPPFVCRGWYYDMVDHGVPVMMADMAWAMHNTIMDGYGSPWSFYGYVTAWLQYQLQGDTYAAQAFVGNDAEIFTNSNWAEVYSNLE